MRCVQWCITLTFIWFGSLDFISGNEGKSEETILPAYMEPPSANQSPKCGSWIQPIVGGKRPAKREKINTNFQLFTRQNEEIGMKINPSAIISAKMCKILKIKKTVIITHGFQSDANEEWVKRMTKALLEKEDANVITVDWRKGSQKWNYMQAVSNTKVVGAEITLLLKYLHGNFKIPFSSFHLVGHSLGAQISSYVCHHIGGKIGRLTALDPARPCFANVDKDMRVDPSDADFVDVIHTNAEELGMEKPVGHVDFYPNGGKLQPRCIKTNREQKEVGRLGKIQNIFPAIKKPQETICSHRIACDYFIESINVKNCTLWGHKWDRKSVRSNNVNCDTQPCIPMGYDSVKFSARGVFFVPIKDGSPCV